MSDKSGDYNKRFLDAVRRFYDDYQRSMKDSDSSDEEKIRTAMFMLTVGKDGSDGFSQREIAKIFGTSRRQVRKAQYEILDRYISKP